VFVPMFIESCAFLIQQDRLRKAHQSVERVNRAPEVQPPRVRLAHMVSAHQSGVGESEPQASGRVRVHGSHSATLLHHLVNLLAMVVQTQNLPLWLVVQPDLDRVSRVGSI
jgi:hypothetical protein